MTLADALLDAQATLRLWLAEPQWRRDRIRRHVASSLNCQARWPSIKDEIVRRLCADAERGRT